MKQREAYNAHTLLTDLKTCSIKRDLQWGRNLHAKAVEYDKESSFYVVTALVKLYAKCGSMIVARRLFDSLQNPDVVSWNVLLLGYAENGEGLTSLELFSSLKERNSITYIAALKSCSTLALNGDANVKKVYLLRGRNVHLEMHGHLNIYVQNTLIDMYAKCGSMLEARRVFESIPKPDVVCWTSLILGYADNGEAVFALEMFSKMKEQGCEPNAVTYVAALRACTSMAVSQSKGESLALGREIHSKIGRHMDSFVQSTLIDMYAKCGSMAEARSVFDGIPKPNVVSWNALLLGYVDNGEGAATLELFFKMTARGCEPNSVTYVSALKACTSLISETNKEDCLKRGRNIHLEIGNHLNSFVQSTLMDMYAKCGSMIDAQAVFDSVEEPNVVSWNVLLLGYADNGQGDVALSLFSKMKANGCTPDSLTYVAALKACTSLGENTITCSQQVRLERVKNIHLEIGMEHLDRHAQSTLIAVYSKCGGIVEARTVFDNIHTPDVVSWTAMITGYTDNGMGVEALRLFSRMKASNCVPNSVTYVAALKACTTLAVDGENYVEECLIRGRRIHAEIGSLMNLYIQNTLLDMYARCGSMTEAHIVFERISKPDVVSWNVLLLGYADHGNGLEVLKLFSKMKVSGCAPDSVTYIAVLRACLLTGDLALGRKFHSDIRDFNAQVLTCLVDFYAKCGSIEAAREVFDAHPRARNITTWNALLTGYGSFDTDVVFNLFETMQDEGFRPDAVTFVCMLLCCNHAGSVEKAREYFEAMPVKYKVIPSVIHYNCMVDVLSRANLLNEAIAVLREMPSNCDMVTWRTLLGACCKWKNVEIGRLAFQSIVHINKNEMSAYVLMGQIYDSKCMWEEKERVLQIKEIHA